MHAEWDMYLLWLLTTIPELVWVHVTEPAGGRLRLALFKPVRWDYCQNQACILRAEVHDHAPSPKSDR